LTHQQSEASQLTIDCWPLAEPVAKINAQDFRFTVPLPRSVVASTVALDSCSGDAVSRSFSSTGKA
jgi:hypothetical protein